MRKKKTYNVYKADGKVVSVEAFNKDQAGWLAGCRTGDVISGIVKIREVK